MANGKTPIETYWVDVYVGPLGVDDEGEDILEDQWSVPVTIDPEEPDCIESEHEWDSDHPGGGLQGHGGGVIIQEVCIHCNRIRITDTWAQRHDTGEQGLHSVRYDLYVPPDDEDD